MSNICVYTCITGDYDTLKKLNYPNKNYDYICFTNNKNITSDFWKVIYIEEDKLDNLTLARKIKILGHKELEKYDLTIWLDGAMQLRKSLSTFIKDCCDLNNYDMVGFNHRFRDCVYDEIDACVYLFKENLENARNIGSFLRKEKYPEHNGLIESTVLVRKNNDSVKKLMKLWFDMLTRFSRRDQLSFNYCLWKNPIKIQMLNMNVFDNDYLVHLGHSNSIFSKKYRVYFGEGFKYYNLYEGLYKLKGGYYYAEFKVPFDCEKIELIVSPYDCILLKHIETDLEYDMNCSLIANNKVFFENENLIFCRNFKKGDKIKIKFQFDILDFNRFYKVFYENDTLLRHEIDSLVTVNNNTTAELNKILNSKSWKLLEKMRKLKK